MKSRPKLLLTIIISLALCLRIIFLDRIPTGISNDEYYFILSSKTVFYDTLTLIKEGWNTQIFQEIIKTINSETSIALLAPIHGLLPSSLFCTRLPYAIIGVLSIYLLFKITYKNTKNINLSLIVALVAAINPWSIYVNRTAFDAPVALFFFLLTVYLQSFPKPKLIVFSALISWLAFNAYIGTKVIYLPFMLINIYYSWRYLHHQKYTKSFVFISIFSIFITMSFLINLSKSPANNRTSELASLTSPAIVSEVIDERNQSLRTPFNAIFLNKATVYLHNFINKYFYNFSTDIQLLNGDHTFMVSLWKMGYFYYLDFFLIIIGLIFLFNKFRVFFYYLSVLILLSPIPEAIRIDKNPSYAFHSSFQYPFIFIILGCGLYYLWQLLKSKFLKIIFIFIYLLLFINYLTIYFIRYPIYQSEGFFMSRRLLANYLNHEQKQNRPIEIITNEPEAIFRNYLYFTNQYNYRNFSKIQNQYLQHPDKRNFEWETIKITDRIPKNILPDITYITDADITFSDIQKFQYIYHLGDYHPIFNIYQGKICSPTTLNTVYYISDLKVEKLSLDIFCRKYISNK